MRIFEHLLPSTKPDAESSGKHVDGRIGDIVLEAGDNLVLDTGVRVCVRDFKCAYLSICCQAQSLMLSPVASTWMGA